MPFLRRRGNMASETDIRRHTFFASSTSGDLPPPLPSQPEQTDDDDDGPNEQHVHPQPTDESTNNRPESRPESRPDTPPIQEENSKHRRFSVLRFRNASDSQLSLRAKQQAEKPPPLPRRNHPSFLW